MRGLETVGGGCNGASKPETCARDAQTLEYRLSVFPEGVPVLAVEASSAEGWCKYAHSVLGMRSFGASAPAKDLHKHFGCDRRDAPVERAHAPRARVTRYRRRAASRPSPSWQRRASCSASTRADRCPTSCAGPTRRERALALSLCLSPPWLRLWRDSRLPSTRWRWPNLDRPPPHTRPLAPRPVRDSAPLASPPECRTPAILTTTDDAGGTNAYAYYEHARQSDRTHACYACVECIASSYELRCISDDLRRTSYVLCV